MHDHRHLPIPGTYNVRYLGGYTTASGPTRFGRLIRADALHRLDEGGVAALVETGVTTVIDLRHAGELAQHPNPFATHGAVRYHNVSLLDGLAPSMMSEGVLLLELYRMALRSRHVAIARVLALIAEAPEGAVLFHCTAGKDRTGIIAALLLGLAGVQAEDIVEDYARTATLIAPMLADLTEGAVSRGADPHNFGRLLASEPATMVATLAFIESEFGSVPAYLAGIGLEPRTLARLHTRILGEV